MFEFGNMANDSIYLSPLKYNLNELANLALENELNESNCDILLTKSNRF